MVAMTLYSRNISIHPGKLSTWYQVPKNATAYVTKRLVKQQSIEAWKQCRTLLNMLLVLH